MKHPVIQRNKQAMRLIRVLVCLSQRSYSSAELAEKFQIAGRTARRDIAALEGAGVPVCEVQFEDSDAVAPRYRIEASWARRFV